MALELSDTVLSLVDRRLQQLHTCIPGRIINVENFATEQTIDIQVAVGRKYSDGVSYDMPPLYDVPVVFPHGGGGIITFPVKVGDTVLVLFAERSIDDWLGGEGQNQIPFDRRSHDLSDAICIPGLFTIQNNLSPDPDNIQIRFNNSAITIKSENGDIDINTDANVNVTTGADLVATVGGNADVTATGDIALSGANITLDATTKITMTAPTVQIDSSTTTDINGGSVTIDGTTIDITGSGAVAVTGSTIDLN